MLADDLMQVFFTYKYVYMFLKQEMPEMDDLRIKTLPLKENYLEIFHYLRNI